MFYMMKTCARPECSAEFLPLGQNQIYCRKECREIVAKPIRAKKYHLDQKSIRLEIKRTINPNRRICLCCEKAFNSEGKHHRICYPCKRKEEYASPVSADYSVKTSFR